MFIASDKYGGIGSDIQAVLQLAALIRAGMASLSGQNEEMVVATLRDTLKNFLFQRWGRTKRWSGVEALCADLSSRLLSRKDFQVLLFTCEHILVPISRSLLAIPNSDREFAEAFARALLNRKGVEALPLIINAWDDIGSYGSMTAERAEIVQTFGFLRQHLATLGMTQEEENIVLTAFCQEFERRAGQKRKGRAGRGVESATSIILEHFGFTRVSERPEHFTTGLEIDRWVKCKDGWYIGISCKRTLRERWKQAYTTDIDLLNRHKIKALWHILTYDRDLSDDKLTEMGSHRARFYLPDDSPRYQSAAQHPGMRDYVRPISCFVSDLRAEVG
ncbi:MAG: hypothetical protein NZ821_08640 [Gloeomargarita sp. SKYB31]|nr:hypothetical protein [Gloeomargarita sp. SKYB31]